VLAGQLVWFALWAGVTGFGIYLHPSPLGHGTHTQLGLPSCPSVIFFGRPCPGCGLTTSFTATIHGHFREAFSAHPMGPLLYALFTATALLSMYAWIRTERVETSSKPFNWSLSALVLVFLVFGAYRFAVSPHYGDNDPVHMMVSQHR
jgi:hypothetical protein